MEADHHVVLHEPVPLRDWLSKERAGYAVLVKDTGMQFRPAYPAGPAADYG